MSAIDYEKLIISLPNYPQPGIMFKDVTPVFADAQAFSTLIKEIAETFKDKGITKVVGAEARGLMIGAPVALQMGVGFVPARKPGKLPRNTISESYGLEYGSDELHIHADALSSDDVVLLVDDLVASGGTAVAQIHLIEKCGARVGGLAFLMELAYLNPRERIAKETDAPVYSACVVEQEKWD
jgi:adenine phosphoribosyltransferase